MSMKFERLDAIHRFGIGEGPHWEPKDQRLYLVDLPGGEIACWNPKTNKTIYQTVGVHASFIIPIKGRSREFIVGSKLDLLHVKWDIESNKIEKNILLTLKDEDPQNQVNDAKCDVNGRLWFGTWNAVDLHEDRQAAGSMYSFSRKEGLVRHESKIFVSNGIGFSLDNKKMYYIDTLKYRIDQYAVDPSKPVCKFEKTVIDYKKVGAEGGPDGMTVDSDGNIWVASCFGSCVMKVDPSTGNILKKIDFPNCTQITSVTFGGSNWSELYVTSANIKDVKGYEHLFGSPDAGATFKSPALEPKALSHSNLIGKLEGELADL